MKIPEVTPRRLYNDDLPFGYLESDDDFIDNNKEAVIWFLENRDKLDKFIDDLVTEAYYGC